MKLTQRQNISLLGLFLLLFFFFCLNIFYSPKSNEGNPAVLSDMEPKKSWIEEREEEFARRASLAQSLCESDGKELVSFHLIGSLN